MKAEETGQLPKYDQLELINKNLSRETIFRMRYGKGGQDLKMEEQKKYGQLVGQDSDFIFPRSCLFPDIFWHQYRRQRIYKMKKYV